MARRRRAPQAELTPADLPDWVLLFDPAQWPAQPGDRRPLTDAVSPLRAEEMARRRRWHDAATAWLAARGIARPNAGGPRWPSWEAARRQRERTVWRVPNGLTVSSHPGPRQDHADVQTDDQTDDQAEDDRAEHPHLSRTTNRKAVPR